MRRGRLADALAKNCPNLMFVELDNNQISAAGQEQLSIIYQLFEANNARLAEAKNQALLEYEYIFGGISPHPSDASMPLKHGDLLQAESKFEGKRLVKYPIQD